jgi:uncharacterized protein with PIN domain
MSRATFRFYAELNDFLPPSRRGIAFEHVFSGRPSVKDAIESLGVPHGEVDLVLLDGESVEFTAPLTDGARVSVFPMFESVDISSIARVRPEPLRETRFVLDVHLGRLAAYLRMAGFDTCWRNDCRDEELARISQAERRILLTRDRDLLKRSAVTHGYWMRQTQPRKQFLEVLRRFDLFRSVAPFTRCLRCNQLLRPVDKSQIESELPPRVRERHAEFKTCPSCHRIYWKGSHHERMKELILETGARLEE